MKFPLVEDEAWGSTEAYIRTTSVLPLTGSKVCSGVVNVNENSALSCRVALLFISMEVPDVFLPGKFYQNTSN